MTPDWLFFDLDGTLLRDDKTLSGFTRATLEAVRAQGHRLVFATARPLRAVRRLLPATFHGERFLCGNGARGVRGDTILWDETLDPSVVADLTSRMAEVPGVTVAVEAADTLTVSGGPPWEHSQGDAFTIDPSVLGRAVRANKVLVGGEPALVDRAEALVPRSLSRTRTDGGTLLQIMPPGIDKGSGVRRFLDREGGVGGAVVGFGDDLNDLALFEACTLSVAPANAGGEVRAQAIEVTPGTNDDDAVAAWLADRYLGGDALPVEIRAFGGCPPDFVALAADLDRELFRKKGEGQKAYDGFNRLVGIADGVLAFQGARAQGCASFKVRERGLAEAKRVYVRPERRGRGVSKALMSALEDLARARGIRTLLAETSRSFPEATGLYPSLGYQPIPNFPPYQGMDDSVCFAKELVP